MRRIEIVEGCDVCWGHDAFRCYGAKREVLTVFPPEAVKAARRKAREVGVEEGMADVLAAALSALLNPLDSA